MKSKMILSESKRDDLLLPYVEILKSKGINCTLGQLKSYMLKKLTNEARMRNLSLGSNFYLAGAVRYYFNGDLTFNKDLDVFNDGSTSNDVWNEDACQKLNALINVLRNAYIDTIGETFEQPEDFGTLTLPKLFRKYGKKIKTEMESNGGEVENTNTVDDGIDRNDRVGNNYSFEIIYSYNQATKYNKYTEPGAWCITYGKQHYDGYIKRLNIHYVIFKEDGFENVNREFGPEWTSYKPQDKYGSSLIAVLQSNVNGEPIYITSRWNHGYEKHCEADHSFTKEEFMNKTGVTDADLQRIFTIWKKDRSKYSEDDYNTGISVSREEKLNALRKFKYAQMRINGGDMKVEDTIRIIANLNGEQTSINDGTVKITKGTYWCRNSFDSEHSFYFLMDRGKIIFDTIIPDSMDPYWFSTNIEKYDEYNRHKLHGYSNLVVIETKKFIMLYDLRRRTIINIEGETKFKCIPADCAVAANNKIFYQLRFGKEQFALLNIATNMPLKLPNGSCWINSMRSSSSSRGYSIIGNSNLTAYRFEGKEGGVLELIYDNSSRERYFYDIDKRIFFDDMALPKPEDQTKIYKLYQSFSMPGYIALQEDSITNNISYCGYYSPIVLMKDGVIVDFDGVSKFTSLSNLNEGYIAYSPADPRINGWDRIYMLYNLYTNSHVLNPMTGEPLQYKHIDSAYNEDDMARILFIRDSQTHFDGTNYRHVDFIFDKSNGEFFKNPYNYPSPYTFALLTKGEKDGSGIAYYIKPNSPSGWELMNSSERGDANLPKKYLRFLDVPGVNNDRPYPEEDYYKYLNVLPIGDGTFEDEPTQEYSMDDVQQMVREAINKIKGLL